MRVCEKRLPESRPLPVMYVAEVPLRRCVLQGGEKKEYTGCSVVVMYSHEE